MENEKKTGDKYSKLAGNTLIFAISSFSSKLLTLIVQPFLTYAMAEISDLGLSKILSQYANLLIPFVSMGMSNAIIRFGLDKGNSEKQVFTNGLLTILGGFGILVLCWPITQFLPDMAQYGLLIYIYVLMSCLRTLCTQFVRSRQWNKLVAVDGLKEMCFGSFEGRNYIEMEHDPDYLAWVAANCESPCPDGETKAAFCERICAAFSALVDKALADGEEMLVILAHGGTQMAAMERYALPHKDYYEWCAPNAGGFVLDAKDWASKQVLYLVKTVQYTKEAQA